jgi:hypothetical protein
MSTLISIMKRLLKRSVADAQFNSQFGAVTAPITSSRAAIKAAIAATTPVATSASSYTAAVAPKPVVVTAVVAPKPAPIPAPAPYVAPAPAPAAVIAPPAPKVVDRGTYAPVPYEAPAAAYIPPSGGGMAAPEPAVSWSPPKLEPLVKSAAPIATPVALAVAPKPGLFARFMAWLGFVKKTEAKIAGDAPMSRLEAAGSLVRRARQGDQNAMAIIVMARQNAGTGNVQAKLAVACIKKYIETHPVGPTSFAGDTVVHTGPAYRRRLQLLARRDIPISRIDAMLGWELGE